MIRTEMNVNMLEKLSFGMVILMMMACRQVVKSYTRECKR